MYNESSERRWCFVGTTEQTHQQDLERLKSLRYMDDDFMTVCLADNFEGVELILRIVLGREDITVKSVHIQEPMKNLQGRSAILDVHAVDSTKKEFDVEIQRKDAGAGAKRARHNSSLSTVLSLRLIVSLPLLAIISIACAPSRESITTFVLSVTPFAPLRSIVIWS